MFQIRVNFHAKFSIQLNVKSKVRPKVGGPSDNVRWPEMAQNKVINSSTDDILKYFRFFITEIGP